MSSTAIAFYAGMLTGWSIAMYHWVMSARRRDKR